MAKIFNFKNNWLPAVRTPETPQLLPRGMLESRLGESKMSLPINPPRADSAPKSLSGDEDAPDSPRTLVTSDQSGENPIAGQTTARNSAKDASEIVEEDTGPLFEDDSGPVDAKAPHPTPLHIIEAICGSPGAKDHNSEKSHSTWHLSKWGSNSSNDSHTGHDGGDPRKALVVHDKALSLNFATDSVGKWRGQLEVAPEARLPSGPDIGRCDINTETGQLLKAVKQPDAHIVHSDGPCRDDRDIAWRQANMTSSLHIKRRQEVLKRQEQAQVVVWHEAPPPEEVVWPKANCLIRPAMPSDFAGIADIMNLEIQQGRPPRVLQAERVTAEDVAFAYNYCQRNSRPFIVAVPAEEDILDRSKWPEGADDAYEEFLKFKRTQPKKEIPSVLGFAFVTETRVGFLGSLCSASRFSGQIKLVVHPAHRRKLYGSALLDRILLCTTVYHRSLVDYQWECSEPALTYEDLPGRNKRKYTHLYIDTFFESSEDPDVDWMTKMLEKFEFKKTASFKGSMRLDRGDDSAWMDLVTWELAARPVTEITDDTPRLAILNH